MPSDERNAEITDCSLTPRIEINRETG